MGLPSRRDDERESQAGARRLLVHLELERPPSDRAGFLRCEAAFLLPLDRMHVQTLLLTLMRALTDDSLERLLGNASKSNSKGRRPECGEADRLPGPHHIPRALAMGTPTRVLERPSSPHGRTHHGGDAEMAEATPR